MSLPFVINLGFFTSIFLMTRMLEITNLIVNYQVSLFSIILMLIYRMPFVLEFIIPMSVMMAVLLTFLRMSSDNEIIALKSGGMSVYEFLPPVFIFCLLGCLLAGGITFWGLAWGNRSLNNLMIKVAETSIDAGLKERTFNDSFEGVMLYVNKIDIKKRELKDVFIDIEDASGETIAIVAPKGVLHKEPGKSVFHLKLYNGVINQTDFRKRTVNSIGFDFYAKTLNFKKEFTEVAQINDVEVMSFTDLKQYIRSADSKDTRYYSALMKYYEKFSLPLACFALGILAIPLGLQSRADRRSRGVVIGLILFLFYFVMLMIGWSFGESGMYPPVIGMWMPNILSAVIGIFLFIRTAHDRPVEMGYFFFKIEDLIKRLGSPQSSAEPVNAERMKKPDHQ